VLLTVAVVPGPPAFVSELMGSAAHELDDLRDAAGRVLAQTLSELLTAARELTSDSGQCSGSGLASAGSAQGSAQLVVVGPGEPGEFKATGPVSFASFGRDVLLPALADQPAGDAEGWGELPTPIMVARYLASRDIAAHPEHAHLWACARWVTTNGENATALGEQLAASGSAVALILVADGAACHGPKAPMAQDARAEAYDDEVWAALAGGQLSLLAQVDAELGSALGASGAQVWPVLVAAAGESDARGIGEVLWAGAPYGVGWAVAGWRRTCQ
jgi:hypothetical protein